MCILFVGLCMYILFVGLNNLYSIIVVRDTHLQSA